MYLPLMVGATTVIAAQDAVADGDALAALVDVNQVSIMQATPGTWRLLLGTGWTAPSGFKALCGGEALSPDLAGDLFSVVGELWNLYGPTETTVWSTAARITDLTQPILIGEPIAHTQCYVLDELQQPVPIGIPGELYIGGLGVSIGYLHRLDLTRERFVSVPDVDKSGSLLYRTGDLVRWRDGGSLEYVGRLDDQVKLRGFRIELGEVEAALARYPGVRQSAAQVFGSSDSDDRRMVGFMAADAAFNITAVRQFMLEQLPAYMVPSVFVLLDQLPMTANGKLDRKALPEPDAIRPELPGKFVAAQSDVESRIAVIWQQVLRLESVGVTDNFFDLGGHSILLARTQARLQESFGQTILLLDLFRHTTVRSQAALLQGAAVAVAVPLEKAQQRASRQQQRLRKMQKARRGRMVLNTR